MVIMILLIYHSLVETPEEIMETELEGEFGKQMDAVESGRRIRKLQSDLMTYMAGR